MRASKSRWVVGTKYIYNSQIGFLIFNTSSEYLTSLPLPSKMRTSECFFFWKFFWLPIVLFNCSRDRSVVRLNPYLCFENSRINHFAEASVWWRSTRWCRRRSSASDFSRDSESESTHDLSVIYISPLLSMLSVIVSYSIGLFCVKKV